MNREKLATAIIEAEEFIERGNKLLFETTGELIHASKQSGRVNRQSLELSDALIDLRRPD